jgi:hypothetical protein
MIKAQQSRKMMGWLKRFLGSILDPAAVDGKATLSCKGDKWRFHSDFALVRKG